MRLKLIAAAVTIATLAMPATAIAGGREGGAGSGGSRSADHGAAPTSAVVLALGTGYGRSGGSSQVRILQRRLAVAGFAPGPVDGLYGPRTAAAVLRFQASSGLLADGIAGPRTLAALTSPVRAVYPGAGYGPGGSRLVRDLQRLLTRAGYSPGRIDGVYGPHTEHAVRRFQAAHRLPIDGIAHPKTFIALSTALGGIGSARPAAAHRSTRSPVTRPAPVIARRPGQPSSASPVGWLPILGVALAALAMLIAALYTRRRAGSRDSSAHRAGIARSPIAASNPHAVPASNGHAVPASNGHPVAASNGHPVAAPNGHAVAASNGHPEGGVVESPNGRDPASTGRATENEASAEEAFRVGVVCEDQDDLTGAEVAYRRADGQGHAAAASNLGVLLERRGDLAGAEKAYRRADERGETNGSFNLAMLLEEQSDLAGAEAAYRRADDRGHAAAPSNLGVLLERRGDLAGAESAYRRADERGDPNGSFNLAVLLEEQSDLVGAEAAYRRADERGSAEVTSAARAALHTLRTARGSGHARNGGEVRVG